MVLFVKLINALRKNELRQEEQRGDIILREPTILIISVVNLPFKSGGIKKGLSLKPILLPLKVMNTSFGRDFRKHHILKKRLDIAIR